MLVTCVARRVTLNIELGELQASREECRALNASPVFILRIRTPFSPNHCARRTRATRISELLFGHATKVQPRCCINRAPSSRSFFVILAQGAKFGEAIGPKQSHTMMRSSAAWVAGREFVIAALM